VWETRVWLRHGSETAARALLVSQNVPQRELARVRRWIRRARAAHGRAVLSFLRHYVKGMEARARRRARLRAAQRALLLEESANNASPSVRFMLASR
jgi:hypothetical protein